MRLNRYTINSLLILLLFHVSFPSFGQLGISFDIKKPKEYDERVLRSERSDQKKFTLPKRFIQNTVTHYNYFFNANNKLNDVLEKAKLAFKDDYSTLLPFYNYTLDVTAGDSIQLDSITYKASTGIALHDLRNDWADNLYLLWGAAFYLQKKFDSAYLMFQFINYAFAEKEKDGYYKTIGSNRDGNAAYSISTKEKNSLPRRLLSEPPSRNDAFIWQIRNFLAQDQFAEAASLIVTLRNDPNFPKRLNNDLHEVQAYWFYKQNMWDSAAHHLVDALSNAVNLQEKARWEYLAAQLFELSGNYKEAEKYYGKVSTLTTDLILDIYARLATIRVNRDGGEKTVEKNVAALVRMAKQDKYVDYRDIIYYMAAQMLLESKDVDGALALLLKSTQYANNGDEQRNKAFLQMAELSFAQKKYRQAYNYYDSIRLNDPKLKNPNDIKARKESLGIIALNYEILDRQDSLQRIAALPEDERKEFVKKLVKQLRKLQGLKDEQALTSGSPLTTAGPPPLFPSLESKGEWYFYNTASRTRGQNDFKARWGTRPNTDNWRRSAVMSATIAANAGQQGNNQQGNTKGGGSSELTFESLYDNLPITPEKMQVSLDSVQEALLALGKAFIQNIEDCSSGIETLEKLRTRFPAYKKMDEVLFNLYYCYKKNGETTKAAEIKRILTENYGISEFAKILATGINPKINTPQSGPTKIYEEIYDLFIEGKFGEAITRKKEADSVYGKNYWTPQLLYIEAVYYIKQRNDSTAKSVLINIIDNFNNTPIGRKATTLLEVLNRRAQIEEELRNMVITRIPGDTASGKPPVIVITNPVPKKDTSAVKPVVINNPPPPVKDTSSVKPVVKPNAPFVHSPGEAHYVILVLNKVDPVFSNEAKNAFIRYHRDNYPNKTFSIDLFELDADNRLLLMAPFSNAADAITYIEQTRPRTANEIIPWLKGGKYSFSILTNGNFDLLKANKDIEAYKAFLNQHFPGKF
jgi:hypothetical protein